ncbi:MAG: hypothetical protein QOH17_1341, partial [Pseudonocardiales bacterium]|nr:hypothetical protein [Pseudonocardiales bacterium]
IVDRFTFYAPNEHDDTKFAQAIEKLRAT